MVQINKDRLLPAFRDDFVLFIFGIRINKYWMPHKWIPVLSAFNKMLKELSEQPQHGLLAADLWRGNPRVSIQYWRSYDELTDYARNKAAKHFPAWFQFNNDISPSGAVGLWHETYVIKQGNYEAVYKNVPQLGLGSAGGLKSRDGPRIRN